MRRSQEEFNKWVYDNLTPYHTTLTIPMEEMLYAEEMWDIMKCGFREWIPGRLPDGAMETTLTVELPAVGGVTFKLDL